MKPRTSLAGVFCLLLACVVPSRAQDVAAVDNPMPVVIKDYLPRLTLPAGFKIELYAENVEGARALALGDNGTVFVGTFVSKKDGKQYEPGKVHALIDKNRDHKAEAVITIAENLNMPNGVAFRDGALYVAEINRILRYDAIEKNLAKPPQPVVLNASYPTETWHGWKFIRFGPDGKLYVPVGAPCNTCERDAPYSSITRLNVDGTGQEIFARGIRNTVGFDWHPVTKELWFTDNGRDEWGDDRPPEELNHAPQAGLHFGFPYRYGKGLLDTTFKTSLPASAFQPAALEMPAHVAPLGMRFYTGNSFPEPYRNQIFLAQHGSWNRSQPQGYRIALVRLKDNRVASYEHFITGWLIEDKYWGRPVDVMVMPDGALLISDDFANCVYRVSYTK